MQKTVNQNSGKARSNEGQHREKVEIDALTLEVKKKIRAIGKVKHQREIADAPCRRPVV